MADVKMADTFLADSFLTDDYPTDDDEPNDGKRNRQDCFGKLRVGCFTRWVATLRQGRGHGVAIASAI